MGTPPWTEVFFSSLSAKNPIHCPSGEKNGSLPFSPLTTLGRSADPQKIYGLAVLPFLNMSSDPDSAYLCDGLTEDLINALTQV